MKKELLFLILGLSLTFCTKDDPKVPNEEEVITTLIYTLTSGESSVVFTWKDLDGDGGEAPKIITEKLKANTTYTGTIKLLNEQKNPAEDISKEVLEEDEDHQFFFKNTIPAASVSYGDKDEKGNPIGLKSTVVTGAAGNGNMTITLRHKPNKSGENVKSGDIANAGGETDVEVTFAVSVIE